MKNYSTFEEKRVGDLVAIATTGREEDAAIALNGRGLSFNKQIYAVFYSVGTGRAIMIDTVKARYHRMRKKVVAWAGKMGELGDLRLVMVTLTYSTDQEWAPLDISDYVIQMRKKLGTSLLGYAWVAELQRRGMIHYHVLFYVKKGTDVPMPDKSGMWGKGMSRIETAKSPFYIVKYLGKEYQKNFSELPKGCRSFAVWTADSSLMWGIRFAALRSWEKAAVKADGWKSLKFWRAHHKSVNKWVRVQLTEDYLEAVKWQVAYTHPMGQDP